VPRSAAALRRAGPIGVQPVGRSLAIAALALTLSTGPTGPTGPTGLICCVSRQPRAWLLEAETNVAG
jgi:hypothetical protein